MSGRKTVTSDDLRLDIVPRFEGGRVIVTVRFDGEAVEGAQVVASGQGMDDFEGETKGTVLLPPLSPPIPDFTPFVLAILRIRRARRMVRNMLRFDITQRSLLRFPKRQPLQRRQL
ncbi:MAG: hypothetical protein R3C02_09970 [Planctomycetaceae bacterium]